MRILFSILTLFSLCTLRAQTYTPSQGRELPRGEIRIYPSQAESEKALAADDRFSTTLTEWTCTGNKFSTTFTLPFAWANRQVLLKVGSASGNYEIQLNGRTAARNANANNPAEFNLTKLSKEGRNTLDIIISEPSEYLSIESWKTDAKPTLGEVRVMSQPTLCVRDVLTKTWRSSDQAEMTAEVGIIVKTYSLNPRTSRIYYELLRPDSSRVAIGQEDLTLRMCGEDTLRFLARIPDSLLWSTDAPNRYRLLVKTRHEGRYVEFLNLPLGFRSIAVQNGRMAVNDRPETLRVSEVSPLIDTAGIAALRRRGYNTLRPISGIAPESLYTMCDTMGMYVIVQAPIDTRRSGSSRRIGGNPSNNPSWRDTYIERISDSYHTTKRHPSVIAFALARESANGICLYESYLKMKQIDETRPFIYPDAGGEWNTDMLKLK